MNNKWTLFVLYCALAFALLSLFLRMFSLLLARKAMLAAMDAQLAEVAFSYAKASDFHFHSAIACASLAIVGAIVCNQQHLTSWGNRAVKKLSLALGVIVIASCLVQV